MPSHNTKKNDLRKKIVLVGLPGFERLAVEPIHNKKQRRRQPSNKSWQYRLNQDISENQVEQLKWSTEWWHICKWTACCDELLGVCDACISNTASNSQVVGTTTTCKYPPNKTQKNDLRNKIVLVGLPGFEPRMTGPESVVLPLHHSPIFVFDDAKVELIFWFAKKIAIFFHIFVKIFWQKTNKKYKTRWLWRV